MNTGELLGSVTERPPKIANSMYRMRTMQKRELGKAISELISELLIPSLESGR
jgi:hypothetical protein